MPYALSPTPQPNPLAFQTAPAETLRLGLCHMCRFFDVLISKSCREFKIQAHLLACLPACMHTHHAYEHKHTNTHTNIYQADKHVLYLHTCRCITMHYHTYPCARMHTCIYVCAFVCIRWLYAHMCSLCLHASLLCTVQCIQVPLYIDIFQHCPRTQKLRFSRPHLPKNSRRK